jgi:hypothetical protein
MPTLLSSIHGGRKADTHIRERLANADGGRLAPTAL